MSHVNNTTFQHANGQQSPIAVIAGEPIYAKAPTGEETAAAMATLLTSDLTEHITGTKPGDVKDVSDTMMTPPYAATPIEGTATFVSPLDEKPPVISPAQARLKAFTKDEYAMATRAYDKSLRGETLTEEEAKVVDVIYEVKGVSRTGVDEMIAVFNSGEPREPQRTDSLLKLLWTLPTLMPGKPYTMPQKGFQGFLLRTLLRAARSVAGIRLAFYEQH